MTLKQLEYFLSCGALLNFRKVAQLHYISPPTLTRHISALEDELGIKLLERNSHNVKLTNAGLAFFDTAYRILVDYQSFYDYSNLASMHLKRQGDPFLIGSYAFDGMYGKLVDCILTMPDYFLNRPIHIDFIDTGKMIEAVFNRDVQVGIDSEAHIRTHNDTFEMKLLQAVPFDIGVEREHPLSTRSSISLEELLSWLCYRDAHYVSGALFRSYPDFPIDSPESIQKIGEYTIDKLPEFLPFLNSHHLGAEAIVVLPETLIAGDISRLHRIKIEGSPCCTNYMLFWRKNNLNPDIIRFLDALNIPAES